jgi:perosamine synthetase
MSASTIARPTITLPSDQDASGRTLGAEEIVAVTEALRSGMLTSTKGNFTKTLEKNFASLTHVKHCHAVASGTAAIHAAISALNPEPGEEFITTGITDMGAITPILYQGAIPVFADVDPRTGNVTAKTIAERLSDRTRAIIATHLFGNPCQMAEIMALAKSRNLPVIEDCAQAFLARHRGQLVGAFGTIGCFSLQQGKHITTGEGGLVVSNDDALARRVYYFLNKAWGYGDLNPDHYFIALNYRLSELQSAVAVAQLKKLELIVARRCELAQGLSDRLEGIDGVAAPHVEPHDVCTWWKYALMVDPAVIKGGAVGLAKLLKERGIASSPRYIQKPAFQCQVIRDQETFGNSRWPFTLARPDAVDYAKERYPGTFEYLDRVLVLPFNEMYTDEHLDYIADSIIAACGAAGV